MKEGVGFVNTSHSSTVNDVVMKKALDGDKIRAIALGIHEQRPPEELALMDQKKVISVISHPVSTTKVSRERVGLEAISILNGFSDV
jgi:lactate dehydrogenase-like 2-hydroxyacid dehydrogenase